MDMKNKHTNDDMNSSNNSNSNCSLSSDNVILSDKPDESPLITRGLVNLTNTCYMNSVLQCLANTPTVKLGCARISDSNNGDSFCESFCELMRELWSPSKSGAVYPRDFKFEINSHLHKFYGYRQHDSHEFLTSLLVALSERGEYSKLTRDFYGEVCRSMNCLKCGNVLRMNEEMWSLTVPLTITRSSPVHDLSELLKMEMSPETMTSDNLPFCKKCNKKTDSEFSWVIRRPPKYLIFHLLRFTGPPLNRKIDSKVKFEVDDLDLSQFIDDGCSFYRLYGVINHYGSLNSGHYTAFCRSILRPDLWYLMNDSSVSECSPVNVVSNAAYILFYEKID